MAFCNTKKDYMNMKRAILLLVPLVAFADTCHLEQTGGGDWRIVCEGSGLVFNYVDITNDVYVIADCEQLKQSLLDTGYAMSQDTGANMADDLQSILDTADTIQQQYALPASVFSGIVDSVYSIDAELSILHRKLTDPTFDVYGSLAKSINDINCGSCPTNGASGGGSGGGSCCDVDFTDIINRMILAEQQRAVISNQIARISNFLGVVTNQLAYNNFLLEHGFGDITNKLARLYPPGSFSNPSPPTPAVRYMRDNGTYGYLALSSSNPKTYGYLGAIYRETFFAGNLIAGLNNYAYYLRKYEFADLTNTVRAIHRDTTNFFSFFRGEIGVQGVLSDWQSEQVSGSYHDFLTNHYLTVVRGGSLSGNQSTKTNWFSRIETLLAALVFTDSAETNTVDTSAGETQRQQLANSYGTANQAAATFSDDFKSTSQSIVTLYQSYFTTFENASMPSHIVLMRLSSDSSEDIEISFQSDAISVLVEACRVVSTFCWASVGILLLYKFLVWAGRCIVVTCQFIYRVISSVFK